MFRCLSFSTFLPLRKATNEDVRTRFIESYVSSLKKDLGDEAVIEVKDITPDGRLITTVLYPASSSSSLQSRTAESLLQDGLQSLVNLSQDAYLNGMFTLSLDPSTISRTRLARGQPPPPPAPPVPFPPPIFSNVPIIYQNTSPPSGQASSFRRVRIWPEIVVAVIAIVLLLILIACGSYFCRRKMFSPTVAPVARSDQRISLPPPDARDNANDDQARYQPTEPAATLVVHPAARTVLRRIGSEDGSSGGGSPSERHQRSMPGSMAGEQAFPGSRDGTPSQLSIPGRPSRETSDAAIPGHSSTGGLPIEGDVALQVHDMPPARFPGSSESRTRSALLRLKRTSSRQSSDGDNPPQLPSGSTPRFLSSPWNASSNSFSRQQSHDSTRRTSSNAAEVPLFPPLKHPAELHGNSSSALLRQQSDVSSRQSSGVRSHQHQRVARTGEIRSQASIGRNADGITAQNDGAKNAHEDLRYARANQGVLPTLTLRRQQHPYQEGQHFAPGEEIRAQASIGGDFEGSSVQGDSELHAFQDMPYFSPNQRVQQPLMLNTPLHESPEARPNEVRGVGAGNSMADQLQQDDSEKPGDQRIPINARRATGGLSWWEGRPEY